MNAKRNIRSLTETIGQLESSTLDEEQVQAFLTDPSPLVRVSAMNALAERFGASPVAARALEEAAHEASNRRMILMGRATVAFEAVRVLLSLNTGVADAAVKRAVEGFPSSDRQDLISYLESEPRAQALGLV